MSRRKSDDNSASVSLFPFLAVLLCTMGALLVVLVAVSRTACNAALNEVHTRNRAVVSTEDPEDREKLKQVEEYLEKLKQIRTEAEKKLREDQRRLTDLENHMRRLQDELQKHVHAAMELDALEGDHYDDRKQAERERDRLHQLIADKQAAIDELKTGATKRKRTYTLVPYEGPNGTTRRPIIVECCKEGIILQPEGVVINPQDLQPPLGSGNALASALRAARDHYIQLHPEEGQTRDTEPYPMLVIRPDGTELFGLARRAIEAADFDFGYEPVEAHWELNYGVADPVLANIEQQALDQARARQEMLAAAAPRAYNDPNLGAAGRFEYESEPVDFFGNPIAQSGRGGAGSGLESRPTTELPTADDRGAGGPTGSGAGSGGPDDGAPVVPITEQTADSTSGSGEGGSPVGSAQPPPGARPGSSAIAGNSGGDEITSETDTQSDGASSVSARQANIGTVGTPNDVHIDHQQESDLNQPITPSWSEKRQHVRAVAVRRTIRVVVREDHIGIVSDETSSPLSNPNGQTIPFRGDTVESANEIIRAFESQVESWGIAGNNLYWRPVVEMQVGPDGQRRADDLARLLKRSEIEVQMPSTATNVPQGAPRATR